MNGYRLRQVSVLIEFSQFLCDTQICRRTYLLSVRETSKPFIPYSLLYTTINDYRLIGRVTSSHDRKKTNETRLLNFETEEEGFFLAIIDETSCITIDRVIVFYNICPQETVALVIRPQTLAPLIGHNSPLQVTAKCVVGASPENGVTPKLICNQGGVWNSLPGSGCRCETGLYATKDGQSCIGINHIHSLNQNKMMIFIQDVKEVCTIQYTSRSVVTVQKIVKAIHPG